jgi:hypothetical protein
MGRRVVSGGRVGLSLQILREAVMRDALSCLFVAVAIALPSIASAQNIVDLSKPQTGKSRFVLKSDMTPADLGRVEEEKAVPVAALSRVPACGEGCRMEQPVLPREPYYGYRDDPNAQRTRSGTRVILITNVNRNAAQDVAKPAPAPRRTFRFRRR